MLIRLDPEASGPMYIQIADAVANQIDTGRLSPGDRLPTARVLADALGVNMHTVLKAYAQLEALGRVEKRRGRGGVVVADSDQLARLVAGVVEVAKSTGRSFDEVWSMMKEEW